MTLEYTVRGYAGGAPATTLSSGITNSATSLTLASGTGYPTTNFALVIDPGTASEEKIFVGSRASGTCSSCTRGIDSTSGVSHLAGAVVRHVLIAQDLSEANAFASAMTTKGDIVTRNSTATAAPQRLAVGTDGMRLVADSAQTLGIKWVADTTNTVADAAGDLIIGTADNTVAKLATVGLTGWTSFTPTLTQSATVTKTVTLANYCQIGKLVIASVFLDVTGNGTSTNAIVFGLPVAAASNTVTRIIGSGWWYEDGAASVFNGVVRPVTSTTAQLYAGTGTQAVFPLGATGSVATTAMNPGNILSYLLTYEAA